MPEMQGKKVHFSRDSENADDPGAMPRRYGAPVAIMFYYLDRIGKQGNRMPPVPNGGRVGARGGKLLL